ncbi:MAG: M57 family metalloprotease [Bacteroidia bacterium]
MLKKITYFLPAALIAFVVVSCQVQEVPLQGEISEEVIAKISNMGFNPDGIEAVEEGYRIERDIIITHELLASTPTSAVVPNYEQYRTTNLVTAGVPGRVITMYAQQGGSTGYSAGMIAGLDMAIARYNAMNLGISFQRVTSSSGADIQMTRLKKGEERQGILGSAGFPTASGISLYDQPVMRRFEFFNV